jgi:hypothetical protein
LRELMYLHLHCCDKTCAAQHSAWSYPNLSLAHVGTRCAGSDAGTALCWCCTGMTV